MRLFDIWIDFVNLRAEEYAENSRIPTMVTTFHINYWILSQKNSDTPEILCSGCASSGSSYLHLVVFSLLT